jgi:hypothetical protein
MSWGAEMLRAEHGESEVRRDFTRSKQAAIGGTGSKRGSTNRPKLG